MIDDYSFQITQNILLMFQFFFPIFIVSNQKPIILVNCNVRKAAANNARVACDMH